MALGYCRNREDRVDLVQEMAIQLWRFEMLALFTV
ncbi:MAG: hypothetical protein M3N91_00705 [Pseudomonadota bacterium]|nr:hypothetical protein [Pseudomonadota bacterium]